MKKHLNKSIVEFVLEQSKIGIEFQSISAQHQNRANRFDKIVNYANALSQTPRLGHFIPCDENDVPLEKPKNYEAWLRKALNTPYDADLSKYEKYQQACDRVLFEDMEVEIMSKDVKAVKNGDVYFFWENLDKTEEWVLSKGVNTFEDLIRYNLPLTEAGAKTFGYEN